MLMTLNQGSKVMKLQEINLTSRRFDDKNELISWFLPNFEDLMTFDTFNLKFIRAFIRNFEKKFF